MLLAAALVVASALVLRFPALLAVSLVLDAALVAAACVDLLRTPRPASLAVDRSVPERVGLSNDLRRTLVVTGAHTAGLALEVHEEFPAPFEVVARSIGGAEVAPLAGDLSGGPDEGRFSEAGSVTLARTYRCHLRGVFALGAVRLRLVGRLGLVTRQGRLEGAQEVAVEPALANLGRTLRLAASERWRDLGVRHLRRRGGAQEFESLREYVHGDDVRRVDWKAFARRGKPMVRQYQVERGQELVLLVDRGRRMRAAAEDGRRRGWTKLDWALDACLELAAVALAKGDRVGLASYDRGLQSWVAPAKGARQLARLSRTHFHLQPTEHDADLARALRELAVRHRRRATVVVVSDVADPFSIDEQRRALRSAARRHRLVFAALDDPALRDAAEGRLDVPAAVRASALELVEDRRQALRALAGSGARVLEALPADAAGPLLSAWLDERRA